MNIARELFLLNLEIMKKCLSLAEFKLGKKSEDYKYMKKEIMNFFYQGIQKLFKKMVKANILQICNCGAKIRQGYSSCKLCGGSGFKDKNDK